MEPLRKALRTTTPEQEEQEALNLALALSLSEAEEERRKEEELLHQLRLINNARLGGNSQGAPSEIQGTLCFPSSIEWVRGWQTSPEHLLDKETDQQTGTTAGTTATTPTCDMQTAADGSEKDLDPQDVERLSSPRLISMSAFFDKKMKRVASALGLSFADSSFSPRVNTEEVDALSADELTRSYRRLQKRLAKFTFVEYTISGDGNCQFASLSDQLYRTPRLQSAVRRLVVKQLNDHPEYYSRFVPGDYRFYCWKMSQNHVWGDHLTLQAAADRYGIQISLVTSYKTYSHMHIMPREIKSCRILWLSFFGEIHYNSLYTEDDITTRIQMDDSNNSSCTLF